MNVVVLFVAGAALGVLYESTRRSVVHFKMHDLANTEFVVDRNSKFSVHSSAEEGADSNIQVLVHGFPAPINLWYRDDAEGYEKDDAFLRKQLVQM